MRVHLPRSLSLGLAPLPGARWERGVAVPAPNRGSGSRPAGIWDEAAVFWREMIHPDGWKRWGRFRLCGDR